ncbi:M28 family peptidase [Sulfuracidifex metallicus]|uniref:M28 family peptidase n=1 Tax=Sulfuracidifex metallicus DSM 6482 = JCM 9184 TaxID=523847 RepID=A0A6A9QXB0_SULME|nr:M28 family peptidase [Sulfuracidifex metallicus]MUN29672.1 M28 family peptidase [Sulfuracidifex metallicus DSM 6482 = JCM 9184]WOE49821.1 M28 family peptidase [Sulfuracidifex metallicus DSM 6482 = JCM 9184]
MSISEAMELLKIGEAIHGSQKEKEVLNFIKHHAKGREIHVNTKEWIYSCKVTLNGRDVGATLMPYSKGSVKGKIGGNIHAFRFPDHPFKIKDLYAVAKDNGADAVIFYEEGKTRRIGISGDLPALSMSFRPEGEIEIDAQSSFKDSQSTIYEVTLQEGDEYVVVSAHYDHWLTGFHDNLFSVAVLLSLKKNLSSIKGKRGLKLVFFPSEEGPRCCTGSLQYDVGNVSSAIVLDSLFPKRVVFSSVPELWSLSFESEIPLKRIEMPTPFSDGWSFISRGVPAITLYNDDMIPLYHSDADLPVQGDQEYFDLVVKEVTRLVKHLINYDVKMENKLIPDYVNLTSQFA